MLFRSLLQKIFLENLDKKITWLETDSPYIISLSFPGVNGETLMRALENEVIVGTGSACSAKHAGNRILEGIGFNKDKIKSSLRVSFNAYQSQDEVTKAAKTISVRYNEILEKVK